MKKKSLSREEKYNLPKEFTALYKYVDYRANKPFDVVVAFSNAPREIKKFYFKKDETKIPFAITSEGMFYAGDIIKL